MARLAFLHERGTVASAPSVPKHRGPNMEKQMRRQSLHRGLECRLDALADRIEALRRATHDAKGAEKLQELGELGK